MNQVLLATGTALQGKANSTSSRESSPSASSAASPQHIMIPKSRVAPARRVPAPKAAPYAMVVRVCVCVRERESMKYESVD